MTGQENAKCLFETFTLMIHVFKYIYLLGFPTLSWRYVRPTDAIRPSYLSLARRVRRGVHP